MTSFMEPDLDGPWKELERRQILRIKLVLLCLGLLLVAMFALTQVTALGQAQAATARHRLSLQNGASLPIQLWSLAGATDCNGSYWLDIIQQQNPRLQLDRGGRAIGDQSIKLPSCTSSLTRDR